MCVEGCHQVVAERLSRRGFMAGSLGAAALLPAAAQPALADTAFERVVDLTHVLDEAFPSYGGRQQFSREIEATFSEASYNAAWWRVHEHTGTHMDAPLHMSADGLSVADIAVDQLVLPLVVLDVRSEAESNADLAVGPEALRAWEAQYGPLPSGACVALNSGWANHVRTENFRNADADGVMHFPGFSSEMADFLLTEREVLGVFVDTLSLDPGNSTTFDFHYKWLPTGRWGVECVAHLDDVPASGAHVVVGAPKVSESSGGPTRLIALV